MKYNYNKETVFKELINIVGDEYVSMDLEDIIPYCRDEVSQAFGQRYLSDFIILPKSVEEIQEIVKVANKHKVPIYPYSFGANISSAAVPRRGGIILITRRMNRILEINEETMTATIEPGVSWSKLIYETKKFGLEPLPLGGGPHTGGPVGNFALGGGNTGGIDMNEVVSIEVVLPNGEILRTASAGYMGHETINPYCRLAFGPNLTLLFRGSLGTFGIITKLIRRLYPIRNIEEVIEIGFNDINSAVNGIRDIVRLGIAKQTYGLDRAQLAILSAPPELVEKKEEYRIFEDSFPEFCVGVKISCHNEKQRDVYKEIINDSIEKYKGYFVKFDGEVKTTLDEMWGGSSSIAIRYLRHNPHLMAFSMTPPSMVPKIREKTVEILRKLDFKQYSFSGREIEPRCWISPWERNESYLFEQDIEFDPEDKESIEKFRKFVNIFYDEMFNMGSSQINAAFLRRVEGKMMPTYIYLLKGIKKLLDPNNIFAPAQMFKDI